MQLYKIIYTESTIGGEVSTDDILLVEELVEGEKNRNERLQALIDEGRSPSYRKVDSDGNIIQ